MTLFPILLSQCKRSAYRTNHSPSATSSRAGNGVTIPKATGRATRKDTAPAIRQPKVHTRALIASHVHICSFWWFSQLMGQRLDTSPRTDKTSTEVRMWRRGYTRCPGGCGGTPQHCCGSTDRLEAAPYVHTRRWMGSALSLARAIPRNPKTLQHAPEFLLLQMGIQPGRLFP